MREGALQAEQPIAHAASVGDGGEGLYILMISAHGLIRAHDLELGRDADTGGQTLYVVEQARSLALQPGVARVDLLTRQVEDARVSADYACPEESLGEGAYIRRITCGPRRYLPKELLWDFMDVFVDQSLMHIRKLGRIPDLIHGHYADAGYAGRELARLLGRPFVFTGHSLGRVKRARLREKGVTEKTIESTYHISRRIEAEEMALDTASLVITSTQQEIKEQYEAYEYYAPERMRVIPPGVNLARFGPPRRGEPRPEIVSELKRFLNDPRKPMILALSRADERKNIETLVRAYGESPELQERANLVIVAGNRDDIDKMDKGARKVLGNVLMLVDRYDLYGRVAYPKHHGSEDVPDLYRLVCRTRGVFVNPALTEPFGLTLIEAAACGTPIVATHDGGPTDIIRHCNNGVLIDPLNASAMAEAILGVLSDRKRWKAYSQNGLKGVRKHYSWDSHAKRYLKEVSALLERSTYQTQPFTRSKRLLPLMDRILITDIDNTLIGDDGAVERFRTFLETAGDNMGFAVATGRHLESAIEVLEANQLPTPDIFITSVGASIHYGKERVPDIQWQRHLDYYWNPRGLQVAMAEIGGFERQPEECQHRFKISYFMGKDAPRRAELVRELRNRKLKANVIYSHGELVDLLPIRASKGLAVRYVSFKWGIPLGRILVSGDSGNDREMLRGNTLGLVVGNYSSELEKLRGQPRIHFADKTHADGILEGVAHYNFLGDVTSHDEAIDDNPNEEDPYDDDETNP